MIGIFHDQVTYRWNCPNRTHLDAAGLGASFTPPATLAKHSLRPWERGERDNSDVALGCPSHVVGVAPHARRFDLRCGFLQRVDANRREDWRRARWVVRGCRWALMALGDTRSWED